ncbi:hypothetical protein BDF14DRAFT_1764471 [Spinellus fusiger]|nr:hypothetical protein BDF14DRAFT_1764471 [Spinellus fusiger]
MTRIIGELVVVALKAEEIVEQQSLGIQQSPFAVFIVNGVAKRTRTADRGGRHPLWDDQVNFQLPEGVHTMTVQVLHQNPTTHQNELLGESKVSLENVLKKNEDDDYFPLWWQGKKAGDIYLELTFYPTTGRGRPMTGMAQEHPYRQTHGPPVANSQNPSWKPMPRPRPLVASVSTPARMDSGMHNMRPPPMPNAGPRSPVHHQGPLMQHQRPPIQHQRPPIQHQRPPIQHQRPPIQHQRPPIQHQGPPIQHQRPPIHHQGPPMQHQRPPMQRPSLHYGPPSPLDLSNNNGSSHVFYGP